MNLNIILYISRSLLTGFNFLITLGEKSTSWFTFDYGVSIKKNEKPYISPLICSNSSVVYIFKLLIITLKTCWSHNINHWFWNSSPHVTVSLSIIVPPSNYCFYYSVACSATYVYTKIRFVIRFVNFITSLLGKF